MTPVTRTPGSGLGAGCADRRPRVDGPPSRVGPELAIRSRRRDPPVQPSSSSRSLRRWTHRFTVGVAVTAATAALVVDAPERPADPRATNPPDATQRSSTASDLRLVAAHRRWPGHPGRTI